MWGGGGGEGGTCAAVRFIEGVRLKWGPVNTGLTVFRNRNYKYELLVDIHKFTNGFPAWGHFSRL